MREAGRGSVARIVRAAAKNVMPLTSCESSASSGVQSHTCRRFGRARSSRSDANATSVSVGASTAVTSSVSMAVGCASAGGISRRTNGGGAHMKYSSTVLHETNTHSPNTTHNRRT